MNSKSNFLCSNCPKILKHPIGLPCGCTICGEHLHDKQVKQTNTIKCGTCKKEYNVKENEFNLNKILEKMLIQGVYLSDEEKAFKLQISQEMNKLKRLFNELRERKPLLEVEIYDHFVELRRQIEIRREEAKARIDDISMQMINLSKKTEATYMDCLKKTLMPSEADDSFEKKENLIDEKFRDPMFLIKSLKGMETKLCVEISELKKHLKEFEDIKVLAKSNEFKVASGISKEAFGQLNLVDCPQSSANQRELSQIVDGQQWMELLRLCEFSVEDKWTLLYRGSEDGFGATDFHSKCDGKSNTLTIIKVDGSPNIFGGFARVAWDSSGSKKDDDAFIFSLVNGDNKPIKMKVSNPDSAITLGSYYGFSFGWDIMIYDYSNTHRESTSHLGHSYKHPQYSNGSQQAESFLAGSFKFQVSDIEVYVRN